MTNDDLLKRYNYSEFIPEKFEPWLNNDWIFALRIMKPSMKA